MSLNNDIICRCEEISRKEIIEAIHKGYHSVDSIKKSCRAGMGLCQGRSCRRLILGIIANELGVGIGELVQGSSRSPVQALTLSQMASGAEASIITQIDDPFFEESAK